jgi:hypothetical protein
MVVEEIGIAATTARILAAVAQNAEHGDPRVNPDWPSIAPLVDARLAVLLEAAVPATRDGALRRTS